VEAYREITAASLVRVLGLDAATAAIGAYQRGAVAPGRYRGRAGQPKPVQEAEYARLAEAGALPVAALA